MPKEINFIPPITIESLEGDLKIELPKIEDVNNPVLQNTLLRLKELMNLNSTTNHKQHTSHDKTSYDKVGWP
jgi:hypothetical protein